MLKAGSQAPPFEARRLSRQRRDLGEENPEELVRCEDLISRSPCFCAIVKAGCPTCTFSLRYFQRLHDLHGPTVPVVLIVQDDEDTATRLVSDFELSLPVLLDDEPHLVGEGFELSFVPGCVLISRDGRIEVSFESFERETLREIHRSLSSLSGCSTDLFYPGEAVPAFQPG